MERSELEVKPREGTGKGVARKLRARKLIPAIFYGPRQKPLPVTVDPHALRKALHTKSGLNTLLDLKSETAELNGRTVMLKEFQTHPLAGGFIHADLIEVDLSQAVKVKVPVKLTGHPAGVTQGGSLEQNLWEIEVESLPLNLPDQLLVDVTSLEIGQALHIKDLKVAEGVRMIEDAEAAVATVFMPKLVVEEPVAAAEGVAAEGAVPAEGEAAAAPEGEAGEKGEKAEKGKAEKGEKPEKGKAEKGKPEKGEKSGRAGKPGRGDKPGKEK